MKKIKLFFTKINLKHLFYLPIILFALGCNPEPVIEPGPGPNPVEKAKAVTENHSITTTLMEGDSTFPVSVYLPAAYEDNKAIPVVYLINGVASLGVTGSNLFNSAKNAVDLLGFEPIIVFYSTRAT